MLVLARRVEQEILICVPGRDKPIVIKVLEIRHGRAAVLGFAAEDDIEILRKELTE